MNKEGQSLVMRDEKYNSPEYPQWLCEEGRALYASDLSFRMNCERYGHDATWRRVLNQEAERIFNPE